MINLNTHYEFFGKICKFFFFLTKYSSCVKINLNTHYEFFGKICNFFFFLTKFGVHFLGVYCAVLRNLSLGHFVVLQI
jgi:hypothetical protein